MGALETLDHGAIGASEDAVTPHWGARLDITLSTVAGLGTRLSHLRHLGPLRIQRPFYPEGPQRCHLYLLHPPGGLVSGDRLEIQLKACRGAQGLLTTPSAGKVYRANRQGTPQRQSLQLTLDEDSYLEWLPQENIVFDGAQAHLHTDIRLHPTARGIFWESVCLGRPASGELFSAGEFRQRMVIHCGDTPLLHDQLRVKGGAPGLQARWGWQGYSGYTSMVIACGDLASVDIDALLAQLRAVDLPADCRFGATRLHSLIVVRLLNHGTEDARNLLHRLWVIARPALTGTAACPPRIWNT